MANRRAIVLADALLRALQSGDVLEINQEGIRFGTRFLRATHGGFGDAYELPPETSDLTGVDAAGMLRWGSDPAPPWLHIPAFSLIFGNAGQEATIEANLLAPREYQLRDASGVLALLSDIPAADPGTIRGFSIRTTATTIVVGAGHAITDTGARVTYAGGTITSARSANTTYHLYVQDNGSILRTTTAPDTPFFGTARGLTGGSGRRYIGSVRTGDGTVTTNYILQHSDAGDSQVQVAFLQNTGGAPLALVGAGASTTAADLSAAAAAPANVTNSLRVRAYQNGGAGALLLLAYNGGSFATWTNLPVANQINTMDIPCDSTPKIQYLVTAAATANVNLMGYGFAR